MKSRIVQPAASFQPPETCTEHEECQAAQASHSELCDKALAHYEEISAAAHHWNSLVPRAIEFYKLHGPRASVAAVEGDVLSAVDHWATMYGRVAADNTELVNRLAEATEDGDLISRKEAMMVARDHDHRHDSGYRCYEGEVIAKKIAALPACKPDIRAAAEMVSRAITEAGFNNSPPPARSWEEGKYDIPAVSSSLPAQPDTCLDSLLNPQLRVAADGEEPELVKCEVHDCNEYQHCLHYCVEHHKVICTPFTAGEAELIIGAIPLQALPAEPPSSQINWNYDKRLCPHCGRRMAGDFDEDAGIWYECANCDYREAVSNRQPLQPTGEQETETCPICKEEVPINSLLSYNHVPNAVCQRCIDAGRF